MNRVLIFIIIAATVLGSLLFVLNRPITSYSDAQPPSVTISQDTEVVIERDPVVEIEIDTSAASLPEVAIGPAIPESGYLVEELSDGLYWLTDGVYNTMFLTTGEGVIAVDAPPNLAPYYLNAIAKVTDEPITHVIYSHSHADHIAAASIFPADAIYIAHEETAAKLETALGGERRTPWGVFVGGGEIPLPTTTFADHYTLQVGSQTLELAYKGPNHEPGNIFIYAPKQKVLLLIDVVFPGWTPFAKLAITKDVSAFVSSHDDILEYEFDHFVGGHLTRLGTRQDVEIQREYVLEIERAAAMALQTVDFMAIAGEFGFGNTWVLFDKYLDAVAQTCAEAVVPNWLHRLGGVDVFTVDHCWVMMESLRVD
jgi:glyoxylase-like metal-dependent hydrolase (beta-lactamase superfamily II)